MIEAVKTGKLDACFAYRENPAVQPIEVTGADRGLFDNGAYEAVAESLLTTSALEEKENRVTEMILTTVNPTTLVMGKILALFAVGAVQILVLRVAVQLFRYGSIAYTDKLNPRGVLGRRRPATVKD